MINFKLENSNSFVEIKNEIIKLFDDWRNLIPCAYIENLIMNILYADELQITKNLIVISSNLAYTKDDILNCYWEKWQKNMKRIGKEWN